MSFLLDLPAIFLIGCIAWILLDMTDRFAAWVERTNWRRVDRSLTGAATFVLFSAATVLVLAVLTAVFSGAILRAVRS